MKMIRNLTILVVLGMFAANIPKWEVVPEYRGEVKEVVDA